MSLTNQDLQAIAGMLRAEMASGNAQLRTELRAEMEENTSQLRSETAEIVRNSSNLILRELERVQERIDERFEDAKKERQLMREEIHITKYSNDTVELLLKKVTDLDERVTDLEEAAC